MAAHTQHLKSDSTRMSEVSPLLVVDEGEGALPAPRRPWVTRRAVGVLMTAFTAALIVIVVFFGDHPPPSYFGIKSVCLTPACVHAASEILYNLSPEYKSIDACVDFERLVCGGWDERHDLRPDQGDAFTGTLMDEASQTLLRHILEAPYPEDSKHSSFSPAQLVHSKSSADQENFNKLKTAYDACMDVDTIKNIGVAPLTEILQHILDMSPKESEGSLTGKAKGELAPAISYLANLGISALVAIGVGADDKDPDTVVVQVAPPRRIGLPAKEYYQNEVVLKGYEDILAQIIASLIPAYRSTAASYAHDLVEFEKNLAAASPDAEDQGDVTKYYNPMSMEEADLLAPQIGLSTIINGLAPSGIKTRRIIVMSPTYMKQLADFAAHTSNGMVYLHLWWKIFQAYASKIQHPSTEAYRKYWAALEGKDPDSAPERWRTCVGHVDDGLGWILSRFFVEKAFSAKAKDFGDQIVSDIKEMFIEKLKATDWMDKSVVELAIEKVHKIVQKIGYPTKSPNIMDPLTLQDYYSSVNITSTTFFSNSISMNRFEVAREWSALGRPVDRDEWGMTVPTVNAYYNPPGNEIVFPAGIMQFPVFDVNVPQYLSYGAFGSVSGHELSHAFDSTGRHYDQNGNYTDWWTDDTVANFQKRADCFIAQYQNFTVPGPDEKPLHVNGKLTLGENIADAGGVSAAFAAWKKRQSGSGSQDLPGLEYFTQDQLFFVNYANWWCGKSRKETAIRRIYTDPHAPKWARIIGTMANSKDFKKSFNCPDKEPVCELW